MGKKRKSVLKLVQPAVFSNHNFILWAILVAGLAIRLAYFYASQASPFFEPLLLDPAYYHEWAGRIAGGNLVDPPVFYGLPLYPFFLGLIYKIFNGSLIAAKLAQVLLGVLTIFFIYKIGEKLFTRNIGLISAVLASFYGPLVFNEQILIPEAIGVPLYAGAFYLACLFEEAPTLKKGFLFGLLLGLAALTKANALLIATVFLLVWMVRHRPVKPAVATFVAFLAVLAPVTAHNVVYGKDFVFLSSHAGFNFYAGNNPNAEGVFAAPAGTGTNVEAQMEDSRRVAESALGRPLKASEISQYWSGLAAEFIHKNPGKFFKLCGKKILLFFDAREISDVDDIEISKDFVPFLRFPWLNFSMLGPFFLLGLAVSFKKVRHTSLVLVWILAYLAGLAAFFVNARYRLPILSVLFPFAALGLASLYDFFKKNDWGMIFGCVVALGLGVWVTRLNLVGVDPSVFYVNAGDAFALNKEPEKALELYRRALQINPANAKASLATGLALSKLDRTGDAEKYYKDAIAADPANSQAYNNLGLWFDEQGRLDEAETHFLKAIELKSSSFQAYNNLGMVYGKRGENEKARLALEKSLELNPQSARTHTNLGLVYYRLGRRQEALAEWKRALEIDPNFEPAQTAVKMYRSGG